MNLREATAELHAAPLDEFVETRARLAAALAATGRKEDAQALKKVRRPSPSAWATNQIVRGARADVDAFLAASDRLRGSQGALVAGHGARGVYQADAEGLRRATSALSEAARRILVELGRPDDRAIVERVLANARASALTVAGREALLAGELGADLDAGADAFGGLLGAGLAAGTAPAPAPAPKAEAARPPIVAPDEEARRREREARARDEARARELDDARREESAARETSSTTEATATRARAALDDARRRAEAAHEAARDAEHAVREAEATLRAAQRAAAEAETRAGRATRRREALET